ncbi:MAG: MATE family efflux transporter [Clostridia bacterium]|nr:MATE family efflux transporter [Clostridia bacterium]
MFETTLDKLPWGDGHEGESKNIRGKQELPEGVTNKMIYNDVIRLAWPSLVELMLTQLASMVDLMMVGQLGAWAISAVGLTTQPKFLVTTIFMALNVGTMALVARYRGADNREKAKLVMRQAMLINIIISVVGSILGYIFAEPMIKFMGAADAETLAGGTIYLQIQMLGMFTMAITSVVTSVLRATGDSRTAMIYNTTANLVNVLLNYLLIFGNWGFPRLEVAGASIATVIGQFVACIMALVAIMNKKQYARLELKDGFKPHMKTIKDIFAIGTPAMGERMAMRVGMIIYAKTVASLGTVALATHQVCMNIQALTFMNGEAFSVSATSLVGQSLGKRRADMAVHYSKRTQQLGMIVSAMIAIVVFFFNKEIIGLYNDDMAIISLGGPLLQMVALIQPLQAAQFISAGVLRGAGDTKYTAYVSSATVMILRPVLAIILISFFGMGLEGAWYALVADQLLRTVLILARYYSGKWRNVMSKHDAGKLA